MFSDKNICSNCVRNLSPIFYECAVCANIRLCYFCFIHGVEAGNHKKTHEYKIIEKKASEISPHSSPKKSKWNINNELNFLNEVERHGVGNWEDVSKRIQIKSADECRDHFETYFLKGLFIYDKKASDHRKVVFDDSFEFHTKKSDLISVPGLLSQEEECLLGFMKHREDFEREYDNDAESLLTRIMSTSSTDQQTENEIQLKIAHIDIYNNRLRERFKRKNIAIQHGLISHILNGIRGKKCKRRAITVTTLSEGLSTSLCNKSIYTPVRTTKRTSSVNKKYITNRTIARPLTPIDLAKKNNPESHLGPFFEQLSNYDGFHVNPKLKAYFRFLNPLQAYQFLNNLHREEILTSEITLLLDLNKRGVKTLTDKKPKRSMVKSEVFVYPAYRECDARRARQKNPSISEADVTMTDQDNDLEISHISVKNTTSETSSSCSERRRPKKRRGSLVMPRKKKARGDSSILSFYKRKSEVEVIDVDEPPPMQTRRGRTRLSSRGS